MHIMQSSCIHFYISKNKNRDILEYLTKQIYKCHFTKKKFLTITCSYVYMH